MLQNPALSDCDRQSTEPSGRVREVAGFDIAAGLAESELVAVRDEVLRHGAVVLRDQYLTPDQHLAFTGRLAQVDHNPKRPAGKVHAPTVDGFPEIVVVSNIKKDGHPIGLTDAGLLWHTDTQSSATPELFVTLNAITIPVRDGIALGDTRYTSTTAAYDALDAAMKARLDGLRAIHSYAYHVDAIAARGLLTRAPLSKEQREAQPEISHPLVRTHPITGRKLLYVSESYTERVEGMSAEESRALLDLLFAHIVEPRFQLLHKWREGDLVVWDNCATQHLATFDYGDIPRLLHRCGTMGPTPV